MKFKTYFLSHPLSFPNFLLFLIFSVSLCQILSLGLSFSNPFPLFSSSLCLVANFLVFFYPNPSQVVVAKRFTFLVVVISRASLSTVTLSMRE